MAQTPSEPPVTFGGDESHGAVNDEQITLIGNAFVSNGSVTVRGDKIYFDRKRQVAFAKGHVLLVSNQLTGIADEMDVRMDTSEAEVRGGLFMQKAGVSEEQLLEAKTQEELKALGKTTMTLKATHVQRLARDHFLLDGLKFTPCDCNPLEPTWHIRSTHADIMPGERALLTLPIIYVYKLPVFALPWMYL
ncbi:MAG: hypothetical protein ACT4TC_03930, partial [Myxococcaceae bacterium]